MCMMRRWVVAAVAAVALRSIAHRGGDFPALALRVVYINGFGRVYRLPWHDIDVPSLSTIPQIQPQARRGTGSRNMHHHP